MRPTATLALLAAAAAAAGGGKCNAFQANAPGHEAAFGGAFGEGTDPCDERGAWMEPREGLGTLVVFAAPYPALAFAWFETVEVGRTYKRIDQTMSGEAGWLDEEEGWEDAGGAWAPDLEAWFDEEAVAFDVAALSAGSITVTEELDPGDDGLPRYAVEGNLVWGNPASAGAAWYSWEGEDVWSLR